MADSDSLRAAELVEGITGSAFDDLTLGPLRDSAHVSERALIVSKLSPLFANVVEFHVAEVLQRAGGWPAGSRWHRQDPDFPDLLLKTDSSVVAGVELKAWFPLSTEITGRFRESQTRLAGTGYQLAVVAWMPEFVLFGRPKVLGVWHDSAIAVARSRDTHYYQPPRYLVLEPEDTKKRTRNLQQTNCTGVVLQGSSDALELARKEVEQLGISSTYDQSPELQRLLYALRGKHNYRVDTNFAKIDRIAHPSLEQFKTSLLKSDLLGRSLEDWGSSIQKAPKAVYEQLTALRSSTQP